LGEGLKSSKTITSVFLRKCGFGADDLLEFLAVFGDRKEHSLRKILTDSSLKKIRVPDESRLKVLFSEEEEEQLTIL
jgi:hypothetical protein